MGKLSGVTPTWVYPQEPEFANIITESEGMKKQYQNLSDTPLVKWRCVWQNMSDTNFWILHQHFIDQKGGYTKFGMHCMPTYIDTDMDGTPEGSDVTVRYVAGTFKFEPNAKSWNAEVVIEKDI